MAYETVASIERFRIIRFDSPFWAGSEFWIVNEKGFFWEPVKTLVDAYAYLKSDEARDYNLGVLDSTVS